jgi:phospholipase D1/2
VFIASPVQPRASASTGRDALWGAPIVYVHAKVSVFDERAAIVSSANLNGRSLYWDSEAGVELTDPGEVRALRERCFRHWLPDDADEACLDPARAVEAWRRLAVANLRAEPARRRGFLVPYDPTPAERFGRDLPGVPNEIV